ALRSIKKQPKSVLMWGANPITEKTALSVSAVVRVGPPTNPSTTPWRRDKQPKNKGYFRRSCRSEAESCLNFDNPDSVFVKRSISCAESSERSTHGTSEIPPHSFHSAVTCCRNPMRRGFAILVVWA